LVNPLARQVLVIASALATVAVLSTCSRSDPERQVRSTIAAMAQAIEQHRVSDALEPLAEDFTRDSGAFGKQEARRVLAGAMLRNEKIQLSATVTEVRVEGERAFAKVRVIATGGAGLLPERGQTWEFDTAWRLEGGQWKVFNAEWREGR
jgi:hypothetical protein